MEQYLDGKKTWIGVLLLTLSAVFDYLQMYEEAKTIRTIAYGALTIGVAGKIEKSGKEINIITKKKPEPVE